jgi:DNA-directed RNA polymerase subunit E"
MVSKEKACKNCRFIYEGDLCPNCEKKEFSDNFKGKVEIIDPEKSEIAKQLNVNKKGIYAIKL